jgi:hypothetical protein
MLGRARTALVALATLTGCANLPQPSTDGATTPLSCSPATKAMPRAHIGPDVHLRVLCGEAAQAAVASVDELGAGVTDWSVSLEGDMGFSLSQIAFVTCQVTGPSVAFVQFLPPAGAVPGDTFSTVVTVQATNGAFPNGTVNVRAEIVAATSSTSTPTIDFGDVPVGTLPDEQLLVFTVPDTSIDLKMDPPYFEAPFSIAVAPATNPVAKNIRAWHVAFRAFVPGDYTVVGTWTAASPVLALPSPDACSTKTTVMVHARAVAVDAGADGADAGASGGSDADDDAAGDGT